MKTGNGKIANLPAETRDELNRRLNDGESGNELVEWLNSKPEVIEAMKQRFDGSPISEQNLSEWRKRGHQQWLADRMIIDELGGFSENAGAIGQTGISGEKLLLVLTAAYAVMIQDWEMIPKDELTYKMAVFRHLTNGVLAVRRGELQAVRIEIARERLELIREQKRSKSGSARSSTVDGSHSSSGARSPVSPDASATSQNSAPPSSVPPDSLDRKYGRLPVLPENASDYFDSLGSSPWRHASLAGSRMFSLPNDESRDGLGAFILPKASGGTRATPLCAQIEPEKLAA